MKQIMIKIDGMKCGMCESHINDVVRKVEGVKKVTSSHKKGIVTVILEDSSLIDAVNKTINQQGYIVLSYEIANYEKKGFFKR